ncbi:MAG: protein kinase domain-containing protein [Planctomycetota bacterium]
MSFAQPFSNYEILARIGSGAMGTVFKARQKHMNRIVALKVLKPALARDERYVERLRREARIVGKLNHPHIVTGYDLGEEGGYHFFVMEFVEGRSLRQLLHEWGMFPEEQVLDVAVQIAGALAHAFDCGVIHRDVKPGNILIDKDGRVKLTDMGLAKVETDLQLTREGATVGTPQYISPEQARDPRSADVRSDLYSLGATLFHMATGQTPFHADTIGELITKVLHERPPTALSVNPALGDGLSLVIRKLLSKDPDLRYQNPRELLVDLQRLQRHEKPVIDRAALEQPEARGDERASAPAGRRRPGARVLLVAGVVTALVGTALVLGVRELGSPDSVAPQGASAAFEDDLRAAATFRDRAGVVAAGRSAGVDERVLARALDDLESEMRVALDEALAAWRGSRRAEAMAWLAEPGRFADADGFLSDRAVPELVATLGFEPDALPTAKLRSAAIAELAALRAAVESWCEGLVDGLLRRTERHLRGAVRDEALALARVGDFTGAVRVLEGGLDGFLGQDGLPGRTSLLGSAAARLGELEARVGEELVDEVDAARQASQRQALVAIEAGLAALDRVREQEPSVVARLGALELGARRLAGDVASAERSLGPFEGELRAAWDAARAGLDAVALEVDALQAGLREAASAELLAFAYRCLLEAGPQAALATLDAREAADLVSAEAHRAAFAAAQDWERALADAIQQRGDDGHVRPGARGGWIDAPGRALAVGDVDWASALARVGPRPVTADPIGRALLLLAAGRHAQAVDGLEPGARQFVETGIWPQLRAAREAERFASVRTVDAVLARAVERRAAQDLVGLRAALEEFDARTPGDAPAPTAALRAELGLWLATQQRRAQLLVGARARFPVGFELQVLDADRVRASGTMPQLVAGGRAALAPAGDVTTSVGPGPVLGIPLPVSEPDTIRLELEVRFPRADQLAEGLAVHLGGVTLAFGVLPGGEVGVALQQGPPELLGQEDALRRALAGPLAAAAETAAQVTHGAWHRLEVEWSRRRGDGVDVLVGWEGADGPRLATGKFTVRDPGESILVRALGPAQLRGVTVEAVPTGD